MLINTATTDPTVEIPVTPGEETMIAALGTWDGATVTVETFVDDAWRAVPDGAFTEDFEIVRVNGAGNLLRAVATDVGAATSLSITLTSLPMP